MQLRGVTAGCAYKSGPSILRQLHAIRIRTKKIGMYQSACLAAEDRCVLQKQFALLVPYPITCIRGKHSMENFALPSDIMRSRWRPAAADETASKGPCRCRAGTLYPLSEINFDVE